MSNTPVADLSAFDFDPMDETIRSNEPAVNDDYIDQLHIDIDATWTILARARQEHHAASERAIQCKEVLDDTERDFLLGGMVIGKNETERTAKMSDLTHSQRQTWRDACRKERTARFVLDAALDNVQQIKLQVALVEAK